MLLRYITEELLKDLLQAPGTLTQIRKCLRMLLRSIKKPNPEILLDLRRFGKVFPNRKEVRYPIFRN